MMNVAPAYALRGGEQVLFLASGSSKLYLFGVVWQA